MSKWPFGRLPFRRRRLRAPRAHYVRRGDFLGRLDRRPSAIRSNRSKVADLSRAGAPYGNRTRVSAVKGRRPGPLDEGRWSARRYKDVCPSRQASGSQCLAFPANCRGSRANPRRRISRALHRDYGNVVLTTCRCSASISTAPAAAAHCLSAAARSSVCRASVRTPCCRRAAGG